MAQPCSCTVSFIDTERVRHSVEVTAESLFEAAVLALRAFHDSKLVECQPGVGTILEVKVTAPSVTHTVSVPRLRDWLESGGKTPREQALKARLRKTLVGSGRTFSAP